jgi:hypothetical protein
MGDLAAEITVDTRLDLAYRLERDTYLGESRLQLRIADLRVADGRTGDTTAIPESR